MKITHCYFCGAEITKYELKIHLYGEVYHHSCALRHKLAEEKLERDVTIARASSNSLDIDLDE